MEYLIDLINIFIAIILAELVIRLFDKFQNKRIDIGCDYCEEAKKTYKTKDKRYWLCKTCLEIYNNENK